MVVKLIGEHPKTGIFSNWLLSIDSKNKKHRELKEINTEDIIESISNWIIFYHLDKKKIEIKKKILGKYKWAEHLNNESLLPTSDKTKKGNGAEIILCEYLKASLGMDPLVYKLRYNPNVEQSMKGDDVLLFNEENLKEKIIVGEAKFRKTSNKNVVESVSEGYDNKIKLPLSLNFVINRLLEENKIKLAEELLNISCDLYKDNSNIVNVGFIFSDLNTGNHVEKNMKSKNSNFIIISLSSDSALEIIEKSFVLAEKKIRSE